MFGFLGLLGMKWTQGHDHLDGMTTDSAPSVVHWQEAIPFPSGRWDAFRTPHEEGQHGDHPTIRRDSAPQRTTTKGEDGGG